MFRRPAYYNHTKQSYTEWGFSFYRYNDKVNPVVVINLGKHRFQWEW